MNAHECVKDIRCLDSRHHVRRLSTGMIFQMADGTTVPIADVSHGEVRRHNLDEKPAVGTVVYHPNERSSFSMVVPKLGANQERQPVFVGPHTFNGQPCGGYGCVGFAPYCDECEQVIQDEYESRWRDYYDGITPIGGW